ncbi:MAG: hypothetical protein HC890_14495 [Chloroflexaceae bacterium]|nr:hypothetical protein [Chloroflexaceae bacterium]
MGTTGAADFYSYSIHLKSGSTNSDEVTRANEARVIRNHADQRGAANVIYAGGLQLE